MKFAAVFASTLAALAMASPSSKRQDDVDYPDCETGRTLSSSSSSLTQLISSSSGKRALYMPSTITFDTPFRVRYCSWTYFKTSPNTGYFALSRENTTDIADSVIYSTQTDYNYLDGFDFNMTIPYNNYQWPNSSFLQVVEVINDYYVVSWFCYRYSFTVY